MNCLHYLQISYEFIIPGRGDWLKQCNDGHKYVCLDDIDPHNCMVYSFGLFNQISFEESMSHFGNIQKYFNTSGQCRSFFLGCTVFGYDIRNTRVMRTNKNPRLLLKVAKIGVGGLQLNDLQKINGHQNASNITYLKVCV